MSEGGMQVSLLQLMKTNHRNVWLNEHRHFLEVSFHIIHDVFDMLPVTVHQ